MPQVDLTNRSGIYSRHRLKVGQESVMVGFGASTSDYVDVGTKRGCRPSTHRPDLGQFDLCMELVDLRYSAATGSR